MSDYELYHYGVIGMKWGIRRARKNNTSYTYRTHAQKKYQKKVDKMDAKGDTSRKASNAREKLETYKRRDANRQSYVESTTVGKSIVKTMLLGPIGGGGYNRMRSAGYGRVASGLASNLITSSLTLPIQLLITKGTENRVARSEARVLSKR